MPELDEDERDYLETVAKLRAAALSGCNVENDAASIGSGSVASLTQAWAQGSPLARGCMWSQTNRSSFEFFGGPAEALSRPALLDSHPVHIKPTDFL